MDEQRVLKEAQRIASKFPFWMVSGNINHLFGYPYETLEKKYELEIKFDERFPKSPPDLIFHENIIELLGDTYLETVVNWTPQSHVIEIIEELQTRIQKVLNISEKSENKVKESKESSAPLESEVEVKDQEILSPQEEYITPDLDAYPPDFEYEHIIVPGDQADAPIVKEDTESTKIAPKEIIPPEVKDLTEHELYVDHGASSVVLNTELGLVQQEYAFDQTTHQLGDISIYLTITLAKTFIIHINFNNYPKKPLLEVTEEVEKLIGPPNQSLNSLINWNEKKPVHVIEIIHELESRLYFINEIEEEVKKILGEYHCDIDPNELTKLKVKLVTYGFKEYILDMNLKPLPNPPKITYSSELEQILANPITELDSYRNWVAGESGVVEIIREIAWLIDKNSRINFEIELLKEHYKNIEFDSSTSALKIDMKGKMKTQDLNFLFQVNLPVEYPMKVPTIKILNEFEIESHEKIKNDLQSSFKGFFDDWTPYSYLVDLFNAISKKIFEVSVVSCVICHKIDCPTCSLKIAGSDTDTCHTDCPYCERSYHKHCWEQTLKSFGKCGFCLKTPPPNLMPE